MRIKTNRNKKRALVVSIIIAVIIAVLFYVVLGVVTSVITNPFFTRMTPVGWLEHFSLAITSILMGTYFGLAYYKKQTRPTIACDSLATGGGVAGFLTFGCSVCNKILVALLGISGIITYFEPIRPFLGLLSVGLLGIAIMIKLRQ